MGSTHFISSLVKYYFTITDIFQEFDIKRLTVKRKALQHSYGQSVNTRTMCCRVFTYFLYLIILDIIKNNVTFIFPTNRTLVLGIKVLKGNQTKEYIKTTNSKMYDCFGAEFILPRITLFYAATKSEIRSKEVVLNYTLTREFFDNINNGKIYG